MSLKIEQRTVEGIVIFDLHGRLVAGPESGELREKLDALAASGPPNVILNLASVHFIDSSGLGLIVYAHTTLQKAGGALKLLHVSKRASELLILTKLATVLPIFDDETAAIDSFFPDREVKHFDILEFVKSQEPGSAESE